jgi:GT2 family glycosyltransferase
MKASIIIPVWNGASVVLKCLDALYKNSSAGLREVICVDNASVDNSADLITGRYPRRVRVIRQPVNLGFAGGINAGIEVAQGEVFVLLNQDCLVQPGWLTALMQALEMEAEFGIAGCTVLDKDGTLNHTGAVIQRPGIYGVHLTEITGEQPQGVEYVTGAAFAIRRQTWKEVGRFDEGYYPGYYEESDYCYRARHKDIETVYVPDARVVHLFSGQQWKTDPTEHTANQHRSRYRFVCKHLVRDELARFFEFERTALQETVYLDQTIGRFLAARETLRSLPDIIERRRADLDKSTSPARYRQLKVGFAGVTRWAFSATQKLGSESMLGVPTEPGTTDPRESFSEEWNAAKQRLQRLRQREHDLLERIYFKAPSDDSPEPPAKRWFRLLVLRPLSFLIGRDYYLLAKLNTVHTARMDIMDRMQRLHHRLLRYMERRLDTLETLTDYDYR